MAYGQKPSPNAAAPKNEREQFIFDCEFSRFWTMRKSDESQKLKSVDRPRPMHGFKNKSELIRESPKFASWSEGPQQFHSGRLSE